MQICEERTLRQVDLGGARFARMRICIRVNLTFVAYFMRTYEIWKDAEFRIKRIFRQGANLQGMRICQDVVFARNEFPRSEVLQGADLTDA